MKSQPSALLAAVLLSLTASAFATDSKEAAEAANAEDPVAQATGDAPAATAKSADDVARELANPNNSLASLTFRNQYRWYTGDLPNAGAQGNYTQLFQPVFPFPMKDTASGGKANLFIRPAFPLLVDQPVYEAATGGFDDVTALGDIGFDVAYGVTEKSGFLWAVGMVGSMPTATKDAVASDQWRLGPEMMLAKFFSWGVVGVFPNHLWRVGGANDARYSTTTTQLFVTYLPGGGWNLGSIPILSYDWVTDQATIPLNVAIGKTVMFGRTPVKFQFEVNYYVTQADAFGPEWMIGLNITPVVPNVIESWIRGR